MGFDLKTSTSDFRLSGTAYSKMLSLALDYGWEPMGTTDPHPYLNDNIPWDGGYTSNSIQKISEEDSFNIATALEKALQDIPLEVVTTTESRYDQEPLVYFSGNRKLVEDFIIFCKEGSIRIY